MSLRSGRFGVFWKCYGCKSRRKVDDASVHQGDKRAFKGSIVLEMEATDSFRVYASKGELDVPLEDALARLGGISILHYEPRKGDGKNGPVFALCNYPKVLAHLRQELGSVAYVDSIPPETLHYFTFIHAKEEMVAEKKVSKEQIRSRLAKSISDCLLPYQEEGILYAVRKGGRCLIGDEMGLGKTLEAISVALYYDDWPILIVCPATLRLVWAEECERWLTHLRPSDIHVVFGSDNKLATGKSKKICIVSYRMLWTLEDHLKSQSWKMIILDESHTVRSSVKQKESLQTKAAVRFAMGCPRVLLLSGTPSLSRHMDLFHQVNCLRPGILGKSKLDFVRSYCTVKYAPTFEITKGRRQYELWLLLTKSVMIRRLKSDVMMELPEKRRQIITVDFCSPNDAKSRDLINDVMPTRRGLTGITETIEKKRKKQQTQQQIQQSEKKARDENIMAQNRIVEKAKASDDDDDNDDDDGSDIVDDDDDNDNDGAKDNAISMVMDDVKGYHDDDLSRYQRVGLYKLAGGCAWLRSSVLHQNTQKFVIFAHHRRVLDAIQSILDSEGAPCIRIEGETPAHLRTELVKKFKQDENIRGAIVSITAGGQGIDLSVASIAVFFELPPDVGWVRQAEDRLHRRGQRHNVMIYYLLGASLTNDNNDELSLMERFERQRWAQLSTSLYIATAVSNGPSAAVEMSIEAVKDCHFADDAQVPLPLSLSSSSSSSSQAPTQPMTSTLYDTLNQSSSPSSLSRCPIWFELSAYTSRAHLHASATGNNLITLNFSPAALLSALKACTSKEQLLENPFVPRQIVENNDFLRWCFLLSRELEDMTARDVRQLTDHIVSLPLHATLKAIRSRSTHCPSFRRHTPVSEFIGGNDADDGQLYRTVNVLCGPHGRGKTMQVQWPISPSGDPMCLACSKVIGSRHFCDSIARSDRGEAISHHELFCCGDCAQAYALRTTSQSLRRLLKNHEHSICSICKLDCRTIIDRIRLIDTPEERASALRCFAPDFVARISEKVLNRLCEHPTEGNIWHADHVVAVADGGGEVSNLDNMRTLCIACHHQVTRQQFVDRKKKNEEASQQP